MEELMISMDLRENVNWKAPVDLGKWMVSASDFHNKTNPLIVMMSDDEIKSNLRVCLIGTKEN